MTVMGVRSVLANATYLVLALSVGLNYLALDYVIFSQSTTFTIFFAQNSALYVWMSIGLSLATAALFGISAAMIAHNLARHMGTTAAAAGGGAAGAAFGAIASGCPVCGAWLLPLLGISGSLAAFPFQGLEIKALAVALLLLSVRSSARTALGVCEPGRGRVLVPLAIGGLFVAALYALPKLPPQYKFGFSQTRVAERTVAPRSATARPSLASLIRRINPDEGFTIRARYGGIGRKLVEDGVIDLDLFKQVYIRAGAPLTPKQLLILTEGLDEPITITRKNSYFLLNLFWALGLANKNSILEKGEMVTIGKDQIASFASTGGWTIAKRPVMKIYAKSEIVTLTPEQQARVLTVARNAYRPCCGNSTAFPDCNHGMALLGMLQLLAASGASLDEMYDAAKYFNAFWFPQEYLDLAIYFKAKDGLDFALK